MSWLDGMRWRPRTEMPPGLDVVTIDLGSAFVTLDRDDSGSVRAIQIGTRDRAVELVPGFRDADNAAAALLELGTAVQTMFQEITGRPAMGVEHVPMGPNTFGAPEPDTDGIL